MVNGSEAQVQICGRGGGPGTWCGFPLRLQQMTHWCSWDLIRCLPASIQNLCLIAVNVALVPA